MTIGNHKPWVNQASIGIFCKGVKENECEPFFNHAWCFFSTPQNSQGKIIATNTLPSLFYKENI